MVTSLRSNAGLLCPAIITTMASGRTVSSNTITSVLAGRANTATVSVNNATNVVISSASCLPASQGMNSNTSSSLQTGTMCVTKSPLEMVQSVVSSIQIPHSQQQNVLTPLHETQQLSPQTFLKQSPAQTSSHILVSSNGQLIIAGTEGGAANSLQPTNAEIMSNHGSLPPVSAMVTGTSGTLTQVLPAVGQQVLGQQTVLVNALSAPFVLQSGVMTVDGMSMGHNVSLQHLVAGNIIPQQVHVDESVSTRHSTSLSPEDKKKCKKRKGSSQTVANMLHIAAQQNSSVLVPQHIQMAPSPQGPVMQALTIVPGKAGTSAQIVMNGQSLNTNGQLGTQQLITNSQPSPQINLLQSVNLLNGATGMVQPFPTIQQFIVPNLGGMVMNPDGTATLLQDTSNLSMQLQLQNVNGQNILTPLPNNGIFGNSQGILAGPANMVIRAPNTHQNKMVSQPHSPGNSFLSPNGGQFVFNGTNFSGQLSPLVANVSPTQQVSFSSTPIVRPAGLQTHNYVHCGGQTASSMVIPYSATLSATSEENNAFMQQNTTVLQQQTAMMADNSQNNQKDHIYHSAAKVLDQSYVVSKSNIKQSHQTLNPQNQNIESSAAYRQSVSTQTAVHQFSQSITTNTFCQTSTISASSSPDTTTHSPMANEGSNMLLTTENADISGNQYNPPDSVSNSLEVDSESCVQNTNDSCSMVSYLTYVNFCLKF